ncbi:MAG: flavin reductase family protein [Actinomycetota bacterium]|nr:flavin reductase family protein [Actinomycetota bacterium]
MAANGGSPAQRGAPDPAEFRAAAGRFATGVTVVTTVSDGMDHAMTANAFTSVSLDPLLVLVCVAREARFHDAILDSGLWGVSVLEASARPASAWFATRGRPLHGQLTRYAHHRGARTGVALLDASLATLECRTWAVHDGGDHSIVVGEVLAVELPQPDGQPLLWFRAGYSLLP